MVAYRIVQVETKKKKFPPIMTPLRIQSRTVCLCPRRFLFFSIYKKKEKIEKRKISYKSQQQPPAAQNNRTQYNPRSSAPPPPPIPSTPRPSLPHLRHAHPSSCRRILPRPRNFRPRRRRTLNAALPPAVKIRGTAPPAHIRATAAPPARAPPSLFTSSSARGGRQDGDAVALRHRPRVDGGRAVGEGAVAADAAAAAVVVGAALVEACRAVRGRGREEARGCCGGGGGGAGGGDEGVGG